MKINRVNPQLAESGDEGKVEVAEPTAPSEDRYVGPLADDVWVIIGGPRGLYSEPAPDGTTPDIERVTALLATPNEPKLNQTTPGVPDPLLEAARKAAAGCPSIDVWEPATPTKPNQDSAVVQDSEEVDDG